MKIVLNPRRHVLSDYPPAEGQSVSFGPVKKWAVIGALILLAIGGALFMLMVEIGVFLVVPLLIAGGIYGGYRVLQNKLHRGNEPRLENKL